MWKSIKEAVPRGNTNIIITDRYGGFCLVRTSQDGALPSHRYMMKTHDDHYYSSQGQITQWMEVSALRLILCSDTLNLPQINLER